MARSAAAKAVSVIFNDSGGVEIGLSGDGGRSVEPTFLRWLVDPATIVPNWVVCFLSLQSGHLAFAAEIPGWLTVTAWFSGFAIFGVICLYNGWAHEAYFPFKGLRQKFKLRQCPVQPAALRLAGWAG
jgi:hypothetical protein